MTYQEIVELIGKAVTESKVVNSFHYSDVNTLNRQSNIQYPAIVLTSDNVQFTESRLDRANMTITYVDRLNELRTKIGIHSVALGVLKDIANRLSGYDLDEELFSVVNGTAYLYTGVQNFADALTGAYMNISIEYDNEVGDCFYEETECDETIEI